MVGLRKPLVDKIISYNYIFNEFGIICMLVPGNLALMWTHLAQSLTWRRVDRNNNKNRLDTVRRDQNVV